MSPNSRTGHRRHLTPPTHGPEGAAALQRAPCALCSYLLLPLVSRTCFPAAETAPIAASSHCTGIAQPQALSSNFHSHKAQQQQNVQLFRALLGISFVSFTFPVKHFKKEKQPGKMALPEQLLFTTGTEIKHFSGIKCFFGAAMPLRPWCRRLQRSTAR